MTAVRLLQRLAARQTLTVALLFTGYASYYFCRSDWSVAMPLLIDALHQNGLAADTATVRLGTVTSLGVLAYAAGKILIGGTADIWGGRRSFLVGLGGAILFTLLFSLGSSVTLFGIAWIGNRFVQSIGWAGAVKVCSKWFSYSSYGIVAGILSLSFLVGDAAARQLMGQLLRRGYGWQMLFWFAAAVASAVFLLNLLWLRESRAELGYEIPAPNPLNVFAATGTEERTSLWRVLRTFFGNGPFIIVCLLSLGTTLIRETFNTWIPTYLRTSFGFSDAASASRSAIFPAIGVLSVLLAGWGGDRLGPLGRPLVLLLGLLLTTTGLAALACGGSSALLSTIYLGTVAFGLLGPYSYLAGAMALDFGGLRGSATSSGLIDGVGYFGGALAGDTVARVAVHSGWPTVFGALSVVSGLSTVAAAALYLMQRSTARRPVC